MKQALVLNILLSGKSAFVTGPAGAGKTFVLNQFIKQAKSEGKYVSVTATTGLAASHLGGTTIHAWSGIGILDELSSGFIEHLSKGRREIIEKTDILIIDEISMLHDYRLDMVDEICRLVRKEPDLPFGGIQVVMSGDFFQLPPVNRSESRLGSFVVNSQAWRELDPIICYLKEQHRQDSEDKLSQILTALRNGDLRRHHAEYLLDRSEVHPPADQVFTELHTVNIDVDQENERRLDELDGDEVSYERSITGSANYVESLARSVLAPEVLRLKKGALVMAVKNAQDKKYFNGSLGTVIDFEPGTDYPVVSFIHGREVVMEPDTWELRDGDKKRASITQIPLRLAWAITVHKSQGMTLEAALIDLRKAFVPGMGYVALSRVRQLNTLYLKGINNMALKMSEEARIIDENLRQKSTADEKAFQYLENKEIVQPKVAKQTKSTSWNDRIEKMRQTYPNAYRPWTDQQDEDLRVGFLNGQSIIKLSKQLGRHEGSIKLRLQKHFGEDMVV